MADQKISQLDIATSSLADDNLVIQRGLDNFSLAVGLISTGGGDTGSFVTTSSISGTTQTFTKADGSTYTNEIVSASFAVSASYAVSSSVEITKEVSSSYADTASYFDTDPISASLTTTDQTISSSVASLSGSASDARNQLAADYIAADTALSASLTTTDQTISASVATLSGSASDARNQLATDYIAADTTLSASLTTTDQTISSSVATLSGSASTAREALASDIDSLSGSASTARSAIASDLNTQSSSFASDRVMRAGDTMTGALTIFETGNALVVGDQSANADTHIVIERNFGRTGSIDFTRGVGGANGSDVIIDVNQFEDLQLKYNQATDYKQGDFRIINDTTNVMEVTGTGTDVAFNGKLTNVTNPTASQDVATKNYADNLVYTVPVMFSGVGSGSSGDYSAGSKVAFSVDVDTNSAWSNDTYTIPEDGVYEIITSLRTRIETDDRRSAIYKGTGHIRIIENPQGATGGAYRSRTGVGHIITSLVTGDTISVGAFQTTTNYPNISENGLSIRKLRN